MDPTKKIARLENEIEGYKKDLATATTEKEKSELRQLIIATSNRLTALEARSAGIYFPILVVG